MDTTLIRLLFFCVVLLLAGAINWIAITTSKDLPRSFRAAGFLLGLAGILLIVLVVFWPLLVLFYYFVGDAEGIARLFDPILVGACFCTLSSVVSLIGGALRARRGA